jgi:DNA-binding MarR family transcriptional regulator
MNDKSIATFPGPDVRRAGSAMFALIHAARVLEDRLEKALDSVDLSMPKFSVLSALSRAGRPQTLGDLAAHLSCVRSNMTQLVDRMEADGLVRRLSDPSDRRICLAELTPLGVERAAAGATLVAEVQSQFEATLSEEDRTVVGRVTAVLK